MRAHATTNTATLKQFPLNNHQLNTAARPQLHQSLRSFFRDLTQEVNPGIMQYNKYINIPPNYTPKKDQNLDTAKNNNMLLFEGTAQILNPPNTQTRQPINN